MTLPSYCALSQATMGIVALNMVPIVINAANCPFAQFPLRPV